MIERWWRSLKSNWIFITRLDSFAALEWLLSLHVSGNDTKMPHAAFHEQTPHEVYFGRGDEVLDQLAEAARFARHARLETIRDLSCEACRSPTTAVGPSEAVPSAEQDAQ